MKRGVHLKVMKQCLMILIGMMLPLFFMAQEVQTLELSFVDSATEEPISDVNVIAQGQQRFGAASDAKGKVVLRLPLNSYFIKISHVAYEGRDISVTKEDFVDGKFKQSLELVFAPNLLGDAVIDAKPDTVYGHQEYHVGDLAFLNGKLLLLTYEKEDRWKRQEDAKKTIYQGVKLVLLDKQNDLIDARAIEDKALGFYTDFYDDVLLNTLDDPIYVQNQNEGIQCSKVSMEDYNNYFLPLIDSLDNKDLASTYNPDYPGFKYFGFNMEDSSLIDIKEVVDEELMIQFRSEYKWLGTRAKLQAARLELSTGIDKEIYGAYLSGFTHGPYYRSLYAPLYVSNDSAFVIDHYDNFMYCYTNNYQDRDSIPISYHLGRMGRFWDDEVLFDETTGDVYSLHRRNGNAYLCGVNKTTGELLGTFKLYFRHPETIKISGGEVYYTYRPFESQQKKYLYKELIYLKDQAIR